MVHAVVHGRGNGDSDCNNKLFEKDMNIKPVYIPYVSKSDKPKGRAKELKSIGLKGDVMSLQMANELLSPSRFQVPVNRPNQKKRRELNRSVR